jgi:deaminated glutathione amidase
MKKQFLVLVFLITGLTVFPGFFMTSGQNTSVNQRDGRIRIASCQFPVSADIKENYQYIEAQVTEAKLKKADVAHFPECALSGYPGSDMMSLDNFDWNELHRTTDSVMSLAKKLNIWIIMGSIHKLSGNNKPHNSLYVIDPEGKIMDRYDKRFCTGSDLKYFTPGDHFVTFKIKGVTCGLLICYDVRFPELYREYRKLGCDLIFQSFYNARQGKGSIHPVIMPVSAEAHAATNYFYMSLTNSSAPESWPCHFITPDGLVQNRLPANIPGILISDADISEEFYDASKEYRQDAMKGKLNSGETVNDPLSSDRISIH